MNQHVLIVLEDARFVAETERDRAAAICPAFVRIVGHLALDLDEVAHILIRLEELGTFDTSALVQPTLNRTQMRGRHFEWLRRVYEVSYDDAMIYLRALVLAQHGKRKP